jgi:hypothetical protein
VIDLELLDALGASRGTEELKEELRRQEAAYAKELAEWDQKVAARMDELVGAGCNWLEQWLMEGTTIGNSSLLMAHAQLGRVRATQRMGRRLGWGACDTGQSFGDDAKHP